MRTVTPNDLANTVHMLLHCARGRIGEAIEQDAQATLDAWDAQHQPATDPLADDPDYAALVAGQLAIEQQINEVRMRAAWERLHGVRNADAGLVASADRGGDGDKAATGHDPSTRSVQSSGDCTTNTRI